MSELIQIGFDYAALPVDAALTARAAAERIKLRLKRTVEDIIEIGRELTAVKDELPHGQFLPWIAAEFEMSERTAYNFMDVAGKFGDKVATVANFSSKVLYALSAPSTPDAVIEKAVAKAESGEKVTVADVKDWKALESELETEKRRSNEWRDQWKEKRDLAEKALGDLAAVADEKGRLQLHVAALERRIDLFDSEPKPEPKKVEVPPADYESTKEKAAKAEKELEKLKKEQAKLVADQVKAKLQGYQGEVDKMEQKKAAMQDQVDRMKEYMDSLNSEAKRIEVHQNVINGTRLDLIGLAAFLNDMDPMTDADTVKRWQALAGMLNDACQSIRMVFEPRRAELSVDR